MSEIRVEKKNRNSSILTWILGLLVAALAIWGISEAVEESDEVFVEAEYESIESNYDRASEVSGGSVEAYDALLFTDVTEGQRFMGLAEEYINFTANMTGEMGLDHEYSHEALMKLAAASASLSSAYGMSDSESNQQSLSDINMAVESITKDPFASTHADMIRKAAMGITNMLDEVQNEKFPVYNEAIENVREDAMDISKKTLTLNQKEDVRDFFSSARVAIQAMRTDAMSAQ